MGKDGTLRSHLAAEERRTKVVDERITAAIVPAHAAELWGAFRALDGRRAPAFKGRTPLLFADIAAYTRLLGIRLTPWEIETLLAMDQAALGVYAELDASHDGAKGKT
ncbi:MAG TPA: hypothetical protein PKV98_15055 [Burkholderiaceae bacterium]|nr:hypothetical protein [Burkholderiaceae bacterium]